jgi:cell division septal protein FtsQ
VLVHHGGGKVVQKEKNKEEKEKEKEKWLMTKGPFFLLVPLPAVCVSLLYVCVTATIHTHFPLCPSLTYY